MSYSDTGAFLGGSAVFERPVSSQLQLASEIERGFPSASLDVVLRTLQSEAIPHSAIYAVVGSSRTLQRKRQQHTRLTREESDRLARLARLAVRAGEALGSAENGRNWLGRPNRALDGRKPLELLATDAGSVLVEDVLVRIEHGILA